LASRKGLFGLRQEALYDLLGHQDVMKDLDVKTLVLDLIRERASEEEILAIFWRHLEELDEAFIKGYFYRRFSA
jgi:hypothetical protein